MDRGFNLNDNSKFFSQNHNQYIILLPCNLLGYKEMLEDMKPDRAFVYEVKR